VLKLADLGSAKVLKYSLHTRKQIGSINYMSPELFKNEDYDLSTDIWYGIISFIYQNFMS
jgi:serine/threonine protein kinase